jgi:tetratricopeptide (TPR) repeat protein
LIELDERPTTGRAKVLVGSAHLAPQLDTSVELQERRAEEALELYRDLHDPWGTALAEWQFAAVFTERGDFRSALPLIAECVERFRGVGDEHRALQATRATAWCHLELGDLDRGIEIYRELLERSRAAGDIVLQARALGFLAGIEADAGRIDEALAMMIEAYELDREVGDKTHVAEDFIRLSLILLDAGRADAAAQLVGRSDAIHADLGLKYVSWLAQMREEAINRAQLELGDERFAAAMERGARLSTEEAFVLATAVA